MSDNLPAVVNPPTADIMERVLITGDLSKLTPDERVKYYKAVCDSLGLNPLTRPFDYIVLNGKMQLYPKKDATDQLRTNRNISVGEPHGARVDDLYVVTVTARTPDGRTDADMGAVNIGGLKGEALANAMLKAVTKAKRRVTLSICGLGWVDESEVPSIPNAQSVKVDVVTGEIVDDPPDQPEQRPSPPSPAAPQNGKRPWAPDVLIPKLQALAEKKPAGTFGDGFRGEMVGWLDDLCGDTQRRHTFLLQMFGKGSSKDLTDGELSALDTWRRVNADGMLRKDAVRDIAIDLCRDEANRVINAAIAANAVGELPGFSGK